MVYINWNLMSPTENFWVLCDSGDYCSSAKLYQSKDQPSGQTFLEFLYPPLHLLQTIFPVPLGQTKSQAQLSIGLLPVSTSALQKIFYKNKDTLDHTGVYPDMRAG